MAMSPLALKRRREAGEDVSGKPLALGQERRILTS
jgi:hypothetical protein